MRCPSCGEGLEAASVASSSFEHCASCGSVWIEKAALRTLTHADRSLHPALCERAAPNAGEEPKIPACGICHQTMQRYAYGGGNTRAEACEACGWVLLERGELARVLDEARDGIAMSEDTRAALHAHRVTWTWQRMSAAELGAVVAAVAALWYFLRLARRGHVGLPLAGVVGLALFFWIWWRAERSRRTASEQLDGLMKSEEKRLAPPGPTTPAAPWAAPKEGARRKRPAPGTRSCPFCSAALPAASTHCSACDSDFG